MAGIRGRSSVSNSIGSASATVGIIATVGSSMFPFISPSSIDPRSSSTVWNASSSHLTSFVMSSVTVILSPIVSAYTSWVMSVSFGRVTIEDVRTNPDFY
ncbi:hypothetical protein OY671_008496 [Metschnikowia pulcherrima]|nr:hypothetical protein OY671_008496 [Metschnikowia pulcherrima]